MAGRRRTSHCGCLLRARQNSEEAFKNIGIGHCPWSSGLLFAMSSGALAGLTLRPDVQRPRETTLEQFTIGNFDPHDWFQRLKKAGGSVRVDKYHFGESVDFPPSRECEVIWNEIKGEENCDKAEAAYAYVRAIAEPFESWATV